MVGVLGWVFPAVKIAIAHQYLPKKSQAAYWSNVTLPGQPLSKQCLEQLCTQKTNYSAHIQLQGSQTCSTGGFQNQWWSFWGCLS